jgi:TolB-like protein
MIKILISLMMISIFVNANVIETNVAGKINYIVSQLGKQLTQNRDFKNIKNKKIAITSIVSLNNYDETNIMGNIISENLIHEMQVRGYSIVDFKTMGNIKVNNVGDFVFSRNINKLKSEYELDYVLSGTSIKYKNGIVINARIIDMVNNTVVSTGQIWISNKIIKSVIPRDLHKEIQEFNRKKIKIK